MPRENSVYKAYIEAILNAKDFIYIENQFFVTSTGADDTHRSNIIENRIGEAIVRRILRAAEEKKPFKVYVILPVRPGFECDGRIDLWSQEGWVARCQMQLQAESIARGPNSILSGLSAEIRDWREYIGFYSLRGGDFTSDGKFHVGQIYIHSKVLIVDDEILIVGSANINDRSMLGSRDSEVCVHIDYTPQGNISTVREGGDEEHGFIKRARLQLWAEHCQLDMDDGIIQNPLSKQCWEHWQNSAFNNQQKFRKYDPRMWPVSSIRTWGQFKNTIAKPLPSFTKEEYLNDPPGRLVEHAIDFLADEDLFVNAPSSSVFTPMTIFI